METLQQTTYHTERETLQRVCIIFIDKNQLLPLTVNVIATVLFSLTADVAAMEASAGLVAGSHNRNELVVIHNHEEVTDDVV